MLARRYDAETARLLEEFTLHHGILPYFCTGDRAADEATQTRCVLPELQNVRLNDTTPRLLPALSPAYLPADDPLRVAFDKMCIRAACLNTYGRVGSAPLNGSLPAERDLTPLCAGLYLHGEDAVFFAAVATEHVRVGRVLGGGAPQRIDRLAMLMAPRYASLLEAYESVARIAAAPTPYQWTDALILERGFPTFDESLPSLRASVALRFQCDEDSIQHEHLLPTMHVLLAGTRVVAFFGSARPPIFGYTARTRVAIATPAHRLRPFLLSAARAHADDGPMGLWRFINSAMDSRSGIAAQGPTMVNHITRLERYVDRFNAIQPGHGVLTDQHAAPRIQEMLRELTVFLLDDDDVRAHAGTYFTTVRYIVTYEILPDRSLRCIITESDTPAGDVEDDERHHSRAQTPEIVD